MTYHYIRTIFETDSHIPKSGILLLHGVDNNNFLSCCGQNKGNPDWFLTSARIRMVAIYTSHTGGLPPSLGLPQLAYLISGAYMCKVLTCEDLILESYR